MTMNVIMALLLLVMAFNPSKSAMVYLSVLFAFDWLSTNYISDSYYLYAAFADLFVILVIYAQRPTQRGLRLMTLSCVSITVNAIGWVIWNAGYSPIVYNVLSYAIYSVAIYVISAEDKNDVALGGVFWLRAFIRADADSRFNNDQRGAKAL